MPIDIYREFKTKNAPKKVRFDGISVKRKLI